MSIIIHPLQQPDEVVRCARMMAASEPWITLERDEAAAERLIMDPLREGYVARVGEEVAGFVLLLMHGALVGYIQSICVAPAWRNQGIGDALMDYAEARIFTESPNVFLCVSSFNPAAQRFYARRGYISVGTLEAYLVPDHAELLMRKTIGPKQAFEAHRPPS